MNTRNRYDGGTNDPQVERDLPKTKEEVREAIKKVEEQIKEFGHQEPPKR